MELLSHWKCVVFFYRVSLLTAENYSVAGCLRDINSTVATKGWQVPACSSALASSCCPAAVLPCSWERRGPDHWVEGALPPGVPRECWYMQRRFVKVTVKCNFLKIIDPQPNCMVWGQLSCLIHDFIPWPAYRYMHLNLVVCRIWIPTYVSYICNKECALLISQHTQAVKSPRSVMFIYIVNTQRTCFKVYAFWFWFSKEELFGN